MRIDMMCVSHSHDQSDGNFEPIMMNTSNVAWSYAAIPSQPNVAPDPSARNIYATLTLVWYEMREQVRGTDQRLLRTLPYYYQVGTWGT